MLAVASRFASVLFYEIDLDDARISAELSITRRGSQDDSHNDLFSQGQNSEAAWVETNESDATSISVSKFWSLDDVEGIVMQLLDDTATDSAEASEKIVNWRLLTFVAAWGRQFSTRF